MPAPYGGADKVPQATNPVGSFTGQDGRPVEVVINPILWRFLARIASQFSGQDASLTPPDSTGLAESLIAANLAASRLTVADAVPAVLARRDSSHDPGDAFPVVRSSQALPDYSPVLPKFAPAQSFIFDTRAHRSGYAASAYPDGTEYRESDNLGVVYVASGAAWVYFSGMVQAALASIPTGLGANDNGLKFFENAVYFHVLQWNNALPGWQRAPGDTDHSDTFQSFGAAPTDGGWHACDGTTVTFLKYDGTTGTRTVPNVGTAAYAKLANTYTAATTAAVVPAVTMNPYTPAGTIAATFTGTLITFTTNLFQTLLAGVAALVSPTTVTPAGTVAATFTGTPATLTGTASLPGDPVPNFQLILYYRR